MQQLNCCMGNYSKLLSELLPLLFSVGRFQCCFVAFKMVFLGAPCAELPMRLLCVVLELTGMLPRPLSPQGKRDFQPVSVPSCLWVEEHLCSMHAESNGSVSIWHQGLDSSPGVIRLKVGWFNSWLMDTEGFTSLKVPFYHSSHDRYKSRTQLRALLFFLMT